MIFTRKYGVALSGATLIRIPLLKAASDDFAASGDWTPTAGDVKISKDGGTDTNIATLPTYTNGSWEFTLSAAEAQAKQILVQIRDSATKAVQDDGFVVETFGHGSAMYPDDLATAGPTDATMADAVWDELMAGHVVSGSFGQRLQGLRSATAQAGAAGSITLDASASAIDDFYKNAVVLLTGGTGAFQARTIGGYTGATKVATVTPNWGTTPDATSVFVILPVGAIAGATAPTAGEVADAVWDEATAGHVTAGTFGKSDADVLTAVSSGTHGLAALKTLLDALTAFVDTEVGAIKAKTDNLPTDPADESSIQATLATIAAYIDSEVAAILAAVDTEVAAIKTKTDQLTFTVANQLDGNVRSFNSTPVGGDGTSGNKWRRV